MGQVHRSKFTFTGEKVIHKRKHFVTPSSLHDLLRTTVGMVNCSAIGHQCPMDGAVSKQFSYVYFPPRIYGKLVSATSSEVFLVTIRLQGVHVKN